MGSDVVILSTILVFLVGLGLISPLIQEGTNTQVTDQDMDIFITNYTQAEGNVPTPASWTIAGWSIVTNIFIAIFWAFTWMPAWLIAFHVILRFVLVVIAYRMIRSGAG